MRHDRDRYATVVPASRLGVDARAALEARWLDLTRRVLPGLAVERGWPIRNDHCFQRALLDAVFNDVWYAHVRARPAFRSMTDAQLGRAVTLANGVAEGLLDLQAINAASRAMRMRA